jgi:hypothetical protein
MKTDGEVGGECGAGCAGGDRERQTGGRSSGENSSTDDKNKKSAGGTGHVGGTGASGGVGIRGGWRRGDKQAASTESAIAYKQR